MSATAFIGVGGVSTIETQVAQILSVSGRFTALFCWAPNTVGVTSAIFILL